MREQLEDLVLARRQLRRRPGDLLGLRSSGRRASRITWMNSVPWFPCAAVVSSAIRRRPSSCAHGGPRLAGIVPAEAGEAARLTRAILSHVSECEGLTIMAELFSEVELESVLEARASAREEGVDLLTWAERVRSRPA